MPKDNKLPPNNLIRTRSPGNAPANQPDPGKDHLACESVPNLAPDGAQNHVDLCESGIEQLNECLRQLAERYESRTGSLEAYLKIVAECQKEMARYANSLFERHALHPAIATVDLLTSLIQQLYEQATSVVENQTHCPLFNPLLESIAATAKVAQAKREYLDIEAICPNQFDEFYPDKHDVRQAVQTEDAGKHKKIERTLIPGLIYRGIVLRHAQVSIYRHVEKPITESKGEHYEPQNE